MNVAKTGRLRSSNRGIGLQPVKKFGRQAGSLSHISIALALLFAWPAYSQERLFEVVPPNKVPYNYPTPPREGAKGYFPIAENGQAQCVVVLPEGASKRFRHAATGLRAYLALVTGAKIRLVPDTTTPPDGMAAIHLGDTVVGKKTKLELPNLRYGEHIFPNLGGYLVTTLDPRTLVIRGNNDAATIACWNASISSASCSG